MPVQLSYFFAGAGLAGIKPDVDSLGINHATSLLSFFLERISWSLSAVRVSFVWCGGWDSNPRRPSPQGPKPWTGIGVSLLPIRPGSGTPALQIQRQGGT